MRKLRGKLWNVWVKFSTWFAQRWVQMIFSIVMFGIAMWWILGDQGLFLLVIGVLVGISSIVNIIAQFGTESGEVSDDAE